MPSTIPNQQRHRPIVIPRIVFNSKSTRLLRRMIRRQQREAVWSAGRKAVKEEARAAKAAKEEATASRRRAARQEKLAARALHRSLNRNQKRDARPKRGSLKDRADSGPSDGEEEEFCFVAAKSPRKAPAAAAMTTTTTTTTTTVTTTTTSSRPVRSRSGGRRSLADVDQSAGSDDEDRVLPNFQAHKARKTGNDAMLSEKELVALLLRLGGGV